jgi:hypothetical protein
VRRGRLHRGRSLRQACLGRTVGRSRGARSERLARGADRGRGRASPARCDACGLNGRPARRTARSTSRSQVVRCNMGGNERNAPDAPWRPMTPRGIGAYGNGLQAFRLVALTVATGLEPATFGFGDRLRANQAKGSPDRPAPIPAPDGLQVGGVPPCSLRDRPQYRAQEGDRLVGGRGLRAAPRSHEPSGGSSRASGW